MAQDPVINVYPPVGTPAWVNGLFVLMAAVAGSGLTILANWLADQRKAEETRRKLWVTTYRDAVSKILTQETMIATTRRDNEQPGSSELIAKLPQLNREDLTNLSKRERDLWLDNLESIRSQLDNEDRLRMSLEDLAAEIAIVRLMGTLALVQAADGLWAAVLDANQHPKDDKTTESLDLKRREFIDSVRKENRIRLGGITLADSP